MLRIMGLELKLKLKSRKTAAVFLAGIMASILTAVLSVNTATSRNIILDPTGKVAYSNGKMSVDYLKKSQKEYEGFLTDEKSVEIVEQYRNVLGRYNGKEADVPHDVYAEELTPVNDILNVISYSFSTAYDGELDVNGAFPKGFEAREAAKLYSQRARALQKTWDTTYVGRQEIQKKLEAREGNIQTPFYFASYAGWDSLISNIMLILAPVIAVLVCLLVSPVFSKHYEDNSDRVLRAAKHGRSMLAVSRIAANIILATIFYFLNIGICVALCACVFNWDGLKTSVQFIDLFASSSLCIGQLLFVTILGGFLAVLSMAAFTVFLSASLSSSTAVLAISCLVIFANTVLNIFANGNINGNGLYFAVNTLSPYSAASLSRSIIANAYMCVGKIAVWLPVTTGLFLAVSCVVYILLGLRNYNNHQN